MAPIASKCCFVEPPHEVITSWIHTTVMSFVSMILHYSHLDNTTPMVPAMAIIPNIKPTTNIISIILDTSYLLLV